MGFNMLMCGGDATLFSQSLRNALNMGWEALASGAEGE
jgi:hypothetical protein